MNVIGSAPSFSYTTISTTTKLAFTSQAKTHRLPVEGVLAAFGGTPGPPGVPVVRGAPGNTEDGATGPPPLPPPPGPADARPAEELAVLYGVAGDTERAPGGTVDVTAIALATVGVVRLPVDDGTALVVKFVGCTC
uniref:Uncharacterized protein n=1 Tax=Glossina austeni TaxID=7395 RepID=A0A1A9V311_GLOAU